MRLEPEQKLVEEIESYFDRLWPLPRSLAGEANRESFRILSEILPWTIYEVPTGEAVHDWVVPPEYKVNEAYIETPSGERICDFSVNNLHLVGYSQSVDKVISLDELQSQLHSLTHRPDAIPYVTSYYRPDWGFCLSHNQRLTLEPGNYRVVIDAEFINGSMTLADCVLPGETDQEILISSYICHPSMANNELSGPIVQAFLYRELAKQDSRYFTYRFVLCPETIGSIAYLSMKGKDLKEKCVGGFVMTCVGDQDTFVYKRSSRQDGVFDRYFLAAAQKRHPDIWRAVRENVEFAPFGGDERQYCTKGYDLPIGALSTSLPGTYPEYHTSDDNKNLVTMEKLARTVLQVTKFCKQSEKDLIIDAVVKCGEPYFGRYDLYPKIVGKVQGKKEDYLHDLKWLYFYADGTRSLYEACVRFHGDVDTVIQIVDQLVSVGLLQTKGAKKLDCG